MDKTIIFNRDKLYEEVWSEPMIRLGDKYQISDVGLRKICVKLGIPTPKAGYWAKIAAGHKVPKELLPNNEKGKYPTSYAFNPVAEVPQKPDPSVYSEKLAFVKNISIKEKLLSPHNLVVETKQILKNRNVDTYGVFRSWKGLHLRVSPSALDRALRIMDALIKGFCSMNYVVENEKAERGTYVLVEGEKVHFSIEEAVQRSDHVPTEKEEIEKKTRHWYSPPAWDYKPTGILSLHIKEYRSSTLKKWKDGKIRLEDQLNDFFLGVLVAASAQKVYRIQQVENERKWQVEQQRKYEESLRLALEKQRLQEFESFAGYWNKSKLLYDFILEVERKVKVLPNFSELSHQFEEWKIAVSRHANTLDPLQNIEAVLKSFAGKPESGPAAIPK